LSRYSATSHRREETEFAYLLALKRYAIKNYFYLWSASHKDLIYPAHIIYMITRKTKNPVKGENIW
jgi:hypothetical protein